MYNDLSHTYAIIKWFKDQEYVMKEKYSTRFWLEIGDATLDGIDRITEKNKNKHCLHSIPLKFYMKR